jgi:ribonuclease T
MKPERYFSVDIEGSGPIPGRYSMLSLGACVVGKPERNFYVELQPVTPNFDPEALKISKLDFNKLSRSGTEPKAAITSFAEWIRGEAGETKPVFVGFNATYDWQFVNWYFHTFTVENPFGFGGVDIKAYFMGMNGCLWSKTTSSQLPAEFQPDQPQTHNALDDAKAQASIFEKLLHHNQVKLRKS